MKLNDLSITSTVTLLYVCVCWEEVKIFSLTTRQAYKTVFSTTVTKLYTGAPELIYHAVRTL